MISFLQKNPVTSAGILALALVMLIFFDVAFLGRTLQPSNIVSLIGEPESRQASSAILPVLNHDAATTDGFADIYASVLQFEPARYALARDIREGQSPWWNPYSASGTLGPEVLVDIKFSPLTLLSAWLFDASSASFDFGLLAIYTLGVFFVLLILRCIFQLDWLAAIAGAVVFLLGGFASPNLNTHIGQPYFFSPLLLFAVLSFAQHQSLARWIFLVLSHVVLISINILTTLSLVLITVHLLGLVFFVASFDQERLSARPFFHYLEMVFFALVVAVLMLGPLWFPIADSFFVTDMVGDFDSRTPQKPRSIDNLISVISPKHFWENRGHFFMDTLYPGANLEKSDSLIAHTGFVAVVMAGYAWPGFLKKHSAVVLACVFLFIFPYIRVFGFAKFVSYVPIIRSIGNQYWGCMSAIAFFMLVSFGVQNILSGRAKNLPVFVILALQVIFFVSLYVKIGFPDGSLYVHYLQIAVALFVFCLLSVLVLKIRWVNRSAIVALMIIVMLVELVFYMNPLRPFRYSPIENPPQFVKFVKDNIGDGRVINVGMRNTLYPEYGAMFGIKQADTQNPGLFPWYEKFFERHFGNDTFLFLALKGSADNKRKKSVLQERMLDDVALDVASVKYVLVDSSALPYLNSMHEKKYPVAYKTENLTIFENSDYLHSVSLVPVLIRSAELPSTGKFDPHLAAVSDDFELLDDVARLGIPVQEVQENMDVVKGVSGQAIILTYRNDEVSVQTNASVPSILVLSDTWHPAWRATVDGEEVHVGIVNEAFRGVALSAGTHNVRFYYAPPALRYGIYAMLASSLFMISLLIFCLMHTRRGQWQTRTIMATTHN